MIIKFCNSVDLEIIHLTRFPSNNAVMRHEIKAFKYEGRSK